jgi:hypothetical protein
MEPFVELSRTRLDLFHAEEEVVHAPADSECQPLAAPMDLVRVCSGQA